MTDRNKPNRRKLMLGAFLLIAALALSSPMAPAGAYQSGAKQSCIRELSKPPHNIHATMTKPGVKGQNTVVRASYGGVEGCDDWQRLGKDRLQLKRSGRWIDWRGSALLWYPAEYAGRHSNEAHDLSFSDYAISGIYAECVRGHREPARVALCSFVRNVHTGKIAARGNVRYKRIQVEGGC
jgi:hypothetical protein